MREAFENSLRDNLDDLTGWCAFADWLTEQGAPLGEFMKVQLALEDESRPKKERDQLKVREAELLAAHEREWLGELAPYLLGRENKPTTEESEEDELERPEVQYRWARGFLAALDAQCMPVGLGQAVAASPAARLLRELRIRESEHGYDMSDGAAPRIPTPPGVRQHEGYFELIGSPCLESVRVFRTGTDEDEPPEDGWCDCSSHLDGLEHLLVAMPRAEEFHLLSNSVRLRTVFASPNLTRLRVFRAYHIGEARGPDRYYEYPLDVLAENPAFANLTHLQFHPHYHEEGWEGTAQSFIPLAQVRALVNSPHLTKLTHLQLRLSDMGDDGVREIIASGILKRLTWLDLRHGCVTDEGAKLFAACPDAKNLERLDLSRNAVSAAGLAILRAAGINAVANRPLTQTELDEREYLREGDFE
ncbi:MAG TPA: TIGR02996 domain-containing protein [Gemmata sp.]